MHNLSTLETPKLAAILAIDVVGYSRLMREDEAQTLTALKDMRATVIDPMAEAYHGRLFKAMGDGFLFEFGSVTSALHCAIETQRKMVARNADDIAGPKLELRMGLNVADIIPDQDDVYGDGVNIAARLEGLAEPSGICVSSAVYEQVRHTFGDRFKRLGPRQLKNIETPVDVYAVHVEQHDVPSPFGGRARPWLTHRSARLGAAGALVGVALVGAALIGFNTHFFGDAIRAADGGEAATVPDGEPSQADTQSEAARINAGAETEAAKVKAKAAVAAAKAEADAAAAEAQAKAQVLKRAVDGWKKASMSLTEAAEHVREAEANLAELQARLVAARQSGAAEGDAKERTRTLEALAQRIADAAETLKIAQARHTAAVKAEKDAREHMEDLKADAQATGK